MQHKRSSQYLLIGIIAFFLLLFICILIRPVGLRVNSGISYYGNYTDTIVPYALAFMANSLLIWRSSLLIGHKNKADVYIGIIFKIIAISMICILLTPHRFFYAPGFDMIHRTIGTMMFSLQMITAIWIVIFGYRDRLNALLILIAFLSGYAALIYLLQPHGYMIQAQIIFQLSISALYIRYLNHAELRSSKKVYNKIRR